MTAIETVWRARAEGIGGQDGDRVAANRRWGAFAVHCYCSRPGVQTNGPVCVLGGAISTDWVLRSIEVKQAGMGVLPTV